MRTPNPNHAYVCVGFGFHQEVFCTFTCCDVEMSLTCTQKVEGKSADLNLFVYTVFTNCVHQFGFVREVCCIFAIVVCRVT